MGNAFAQPPAPNIVLIFTDDQQFNALAANGNSILRTPTMDHIAAQGVRFTQARAALPVCSPSRATILTGQFNNTNGVEDLGNNINAASPKLGLELKKAGYTTGVTGKWHLGKESNETAMGFDYYATFDSNGSYYHRKFDVNGNIIHLPRQLDPNSIHIDIYSADRASEFIDLANSQSQPFFLWHNTQTPHLNGALKWNALQKNLDRYDADDFFDLGNNVNNLPGNWNDDLDNKPPYYQIIRNYTKAQQDYGYSDPNSLAQHIGEYYAVITELNDMLKPVMDKLENTPDPRNPGHNLIDNTYVFFMSDNGWLMGDHAMTSKSLPFDQSSRVPMMVMGPNVDRGRVDDRQVSNVDIAPTILDIAGAAVPDSMQGRSLMGMFGDNGSGAGVRNTNIVEIWKSTFAGNKPILAGYDGRYEVFYTYDIQSDELPSFVEIYDTRNDPWELNNLAETIGENSPAYRAIREIQGDIQTHRVKNLGIASHATKTVDTGETFALVNLALTPEVTSETTSPRVVAANVDARNGSRVEGKGVILGNFFARSGAEVSIGETTTTLKSAAAVVDFNDLKLGPLAGQTGGTGWAGDTLADNSDIGGTIDVVAQDLVAPSSTNYGLGQAEKKQHAQRLTEGASTVRYNLKTNMGGVIWFSFLAKVDENGGRAGINIDGHGGFSDNRLLLCDQGTVLDFFVQGSPSDLNDFTPSTATINETQLIVGRLTLSTGDDLLEWWVNPDVSLGEPGLSSSSDMAYKLNDRDFDEDDGSPGIQQWSIHLYSGGHIDNFVISNESDGFEDVTTSLTFTEKSSSATSMLSPAYLRVSGDYLHEPGATLRIDLANKTDNEQLIVDGQLKIQGGTLEVTLVDGFIPEQGQLFDLLEFTNLIGSFDTLKLPSLPNGLTWDRSMLLVTGELQVVAEDADFNNDGGVDGLDFLIWQRGVGSTDQSDNSKGDANLDGVVDSDDLKIWKHQRSNSD